MIVGRNGTSAILSDHRVEWPALRTRAVLGGAVISLMLVACSGCTRAARIAHASAPNPTGCYVEVFAGERASGERDFINGPGKYWRLTALPFGARWHNRIRSLRVGPAATVTAWAREGFEGPSIQFRPEQKVPSLTDTFSGRIASLQIACKTGPSAARHPNRGLSIPQ
jgi:hypothetical protein